MALKYGIVHERRYIMKKQMSMRLISVFALMMLILTMAALTGCGSRKAEDEESKTFIDVTDDGLVAHFYGNNKGVAGGSGITIGEGQYLSIDNQLKEGGVHVTVTAGGNDVNAAPVKEDHPATIDYTFDGNGGVTDYYEIEPGSYMVGFSVEEKAVGDIYVNVKTEK